MSFDAPGNNASTPTFQQVYAQSVAPQIVLTAALGGVQIRDASTPIAAPLFSVTDNAGTTSFLEVLATGVNVAGNIGVTGNVDGRDVAADGTAQDTHIADATIHFTEASIDHTAITNIGTNNHAAIDSHIADGTIHFTVASIDHGLLAGLADDDHTQYALLLGRVGGQTLFGGTAAGNTLDLAGSSDAGQGIMNFNSPVELQDVLPSGATTANNFRMIAPISTGAGVTIMSTINSNRTVTINAAVWFNSQIADSGTYIQAITPGFSAFTLFNAFPIITTGGPTAATSLISSLTMQSAVIHENDGDGAGMTAVANTGISYRPGVRTTTIGDTMTTGEATALSVTPQIIALVAGSTVAFTTVRGVHLVNPATTGHLGTGTIGTYVGLDYENITFGTGLKIAVRLAQAAGASNYFLRHTGTARSDFGGSIFLGAGATVDVELSRGAANRLDLASGDGFNIISGAFTHAGTFGIFGVAAVVQPTAGGITAGFTAGIGTGVNDDSTFTGNTGASAYTLGDVVRALKDIGAVAV